MKEEKHYVPICDCGICKYRKEGYNRALVDIKQMLKEHTKSNCLCEVQVNECGYCEQYKDYKKKIEEMKK